MNFSKAPHPHGIVFGMIGADAAPLLPNPETAATHVPSIDIDPAPFVPQDGRFPNKGGWYGAHPGDGNGLIRGEAIR